jgi:hypothetical protein
VFNVRRTPAFAFEQRERTAVCRSFIRVDEVGICQPFTLFKIFPRKQYAALLLRRGEEIKIYGAPSVVNGTGQVSPSAINFDLRFIKMP